MKCKSIIFNGKSIILTYLRIITILILWCVIVSHQETYNYKEMEILDDLPVKNDLDKYLGALEKVVYFIDGHRFYVDIELCFGIYLVNLNLRNIVHSRGHYLNFQKQIRLMHLLKINDEIISHYIKVRNEDPHPIPNVLVKVLNLYVNRTLLWPKLNEKFNSKLLKQTKFYSRRNLEVIYFKWPLYMNNVYDYHQSYPSPGESDHCLTLLSQNPKNFKSSFFHCQVPYHCLKMVLKGSDYGYGISHRLLFLLAARYWRSCVIMSIPDDKLVIDKLCAKMYNELEYISYHEFALPDLFMEHVTLCSLEGHSQFLRRSWIEELLDFQTRYGCFNVTKSNSDDTLDVNATTEKRLIKLKNIDWEKNCNPHTTAVAGSMLASAIRLIMENYF